MTDHTDARELTYCDPDAETLPEAGEDQPTAADAARFLLDLFDRSGGRLGQREAVGRFLEEYGGRFVTPGRGEFAIDKGVRQRFELLAGLEVLWDAGDRCWRWRQPGER
jgi:hypothetical protein